MSSRMIFTHQKCANCGWALFSRSEGGFLFCSNKDCPHSETAEKKNEELQALWDETLPFRKFIQKQFETDKWKNLDPGSSYFEGAIHIIMKLYQQISEAKEQITIEESTERFLRIDTTDLYDALRRVNKKLEAEK